MRSRSIGSWFVLFALAVASPLLVAGPAPAQDEEEAETETEGKPSLVYRSERYHFQVTGPAGWTKEPDGARAAGSWIDLVAYRHPETNARLLVSVQASRHSTFEALLEDRRKHYRGIKSIVVGRGPERLSSQMGVRPRGVYVEFQHGGAETPYQGFTAYYLAGGSIIRLYGTVREDEYDTVRSDFSAFGSSLRIFTRDVAAAEPNFIHDGSRLALVFPPNWTVRVPSSDAVASFRDERGRVTITAHVERGDRSLERFATNRVGVLRRSRVGDLESGEITDHAQRGEPVATITYTQSQGDARYAYREVCLSGGEDRYVRLVLSGRPENLENGREALDRMVATVRFTGK